MAEVNFLEDYVFPYVAIFLGFFLFLSRTHTLGALMTLCQEFKNI